MYYTDTVFGSLAMCLPFATVALVDGTTVSVHNYVVLDSMVEGRCQILGSWIPLVRTLST